MLELADAGADGESSQASPSSTTDGQKPQTLPAEATPAANTTIAPAPTASVEPEVRCDLFHRVFESLDEPTPRSARESVTGAYRARLAAEVDALKNGRAGAATLPLTALSAWGEGARCALNPCFYL